MEVTKDTIIADILHYDESLADIFFGIGMHCLGCTMAKAETIEEACMAHEVDADELVKKINERLNA